MTKTLKENYENKKLILLKEEFKSNVLLVEKIERKILEDSEYYRDKLEFLKTLKITTTQKVALEVEVDKHLEALSVGGNEKEFTGSVIAAGAFLAVLEQGISQLNGIFSNFFGKKKFSAIKSSPERVKYLADEKEIDYLEETGSSSLRKTLIAAFSPAESSSWQKAKSAVKGIVSGLVKFFRFGNPADKKFNESIDEVMADAVLGMSMKDVQRMIAQWATGPSIDQEISNISGKLPALAGISANDNGVPRGPTYGAKNPSSVLEPEDDFAFVEDGEQYTPPSKKITPSGEESAAKRQAAVAKIDAPVNSDVPTTKSRFPLPPPRGSSTSRLPLPQRSEKISPNSPLMHALADKAREELNLGRSSFAMKTTKDIIQWLAQQGKLTEALEKGMLKLIVNKEALQNLLK